MPRWTAVLHPRVSLLPPLPPHQPISRSRIGKTAKPPNFVLAQSAAGRGGARRRRWGVEVQNRGLLCRLWASGGRAQPILTVTQGAPPLPPPDGPRANQPVPRQSNARTCVSL